MWNVRNTNGQPQSTAPDASVVGRPALEIHYLRQQ